MGTAEAVNVESGPVETAVDEGLRDDGELGIDRISGGNDGVIMFEVVTDPISEVAIKLTELGAWVSDIRVGRLVDGVMVNSSMDDCVGINVVDDVNSSVGDLSLAPVPVVATDAVI